METQHLHIKNMVCPRCELVVEQTLTNLGISFSLVELGHAIIEKIDFKKQSLLEEKFNKLGFKLIYDKNQKVVEQVKISCRGYLDKIENQLVITKLSEYLAVNIGKNYSYLSKLFSTTEGITIEAYFLKLKIERVKQLLNYGENSLTEIAYKLNYSSVHYLSSQFKKIEGCTVSSYIQQHKWA